MTAILILDSHIKQISHSIIRKKREGKLNLSVKFTPELTNDPVLQNPSVIIYSKQSAQTNCATQFYDIV